MSAMITHRHRQCKVVAQKRITLGVDDRSTVAPIQQNSPSHDSRGSQQCYNQQSKPEHRRPNDQNTDHHRQRYDRKKEQAVNLFHSKYGRLPGTSYGEIERKARRLYNAEAAKTKRNPYVRNPFFKKEKVFLALFWEHLNQKPRKDRKRRLKYYGCALDLLKNTTAAPITKLNPNGRNELVHRFAGISKDNELFFVQVKEDLKTGNKYFMSVFSPE
jgi:hypothetical protein